MQIYILPKISWLRLWQLLDTNKTHNSNLGNKQILSNRKKPPHPPLPPLSSPYLPETRLMLYWFSSPFLSFCPFQAKPF